ncbi:hypothetical protein SAMN05444722_2463 [Rhodovulum sp. ES.010]|uniref:esterase-like activity of phytase family protein n=1 Tax=Rhodovulum sp. ES.010 TaxID=1882821 RepID=UPI000927D0FB|nr:esterase-like activity of phytase family protein [Rhodovulum sp. ES.010]SIO47846.1 hypothetical protein SAMN05444722_2463 [Rhodovulum sp. ES.010]
MPKRAGRRLAGALLLGLAFACPGAADTARLVARLGLPSSAATHGLSGIEISSGGTDLLAITDKGLFVTGRIARRDGRPVTVDLDPPPIEMTGFHEVHLPSRHGDAEGLAVGPDGRVHVAFEGYHRVRVWSDLRKPAHWMPDLPDAADLGSNAGMEALAYGPGGVLYAVPETVTPGTGGFRVLRFVLPAPWAYENGEPVYRYRFTPWTRAFTLPRRGLFRPVGADFGPDGRFYLLERAFIPPLGFRTRVRRFVMGAEGPEDETVLLSTVVGRHGNLEGLAVWRDATGAIRLTMAADDNGAFFQRSEIVEYRVVSAPGDG